MTMLHLRPNGTPKTLPLVTKNGRQTPDLHSSQWGKRGTYCASMRCSSSGLCFLFSIVMMKVPSVNWAWTSGSLDNPERRKDARPPPFFGLQPAMPTNVSACMHKCFAYISPGGCGYHCKSNPDQKSLILTSAFTPRGRVG